MPDYAVFGGRLRSALRMAGLSPLPPAGTPDWRLRVVRGPPPADAGAPVAALDDGVLRVRLFARAGGWRLVFDDTGTYDVAAAGEVVWYPRRAAPRELVQADVLGRVFALLLALRGWLPLHASAVTLGGCGVAFLAPRSHGKSTLAAALALAGGRLAGDDMAVVEPGPPVHLLPGVPLPRLDADASLALHDRGLRGAPPSPCKRAVAMDAVRVRRTAAPLAALYLLAPLDGEGRPAARRVRLTPTEGAMAMVAHAKLGPLLAGAAAAAHLARSAAVAARVPVYRLEVAPGLHRLDQVVERVLAWHPGRPVRRATAVP